MIGLGERAELAEIALLCAREAAALVIAGHRRPSHVDRKSATDLVTEYDRASQELLCARLTSLAATIPVVAEEDLGATAGRAPDRRGLVWYVDPLDGTTNFVHGHPFWCVSIGLVDAGEPVLGAVVAPVIGVSWVGWLGEGGAAGEVRRNGERCRVSETALLGDALLATGFPVVRDRAPEDNFDSFVAVKRASRGVRRCGSAAMDLCFVADGTYDGYWERALHVWDVAGGTALVRAAGGVVTALDGGEPDLFVGNIVASNGRLHADLVRTIG